MAENDQIGVVQHYYTKIGVAVVELKAQLKIGDRILVRGSRTNFEQIVESMQIEHKDIKTVGAGASIGLKVNESVEEGDIVYRK